MSRLPRAKCPACGLVRAVQPPAGGDGSVDVFPRHQDPTSGKRCEHGRMIVRRDEIVDDGGSVAR